MSSQCDSSAVKVEKKKQKVPRWKTQMETPVTRKVSEEVDEYSKKVYNIPGCELLIILKHEHQKFARSINPSRFGDKRKITSVQEFQRIIDWKPEILSDDIEKCAYANLMMKMMEYFKANNMLKK